MTSQLSIQLLTPAVVPLNDQSGAPLREAQKLGVIQNILDHKIGPEIASLKGYLGPQSQEIASSRKFLNFLPVVNIIPTLAEVVCEPQPIEQCYLGEKGVNTGELTRRIDSCMSQKGFGAGFINEVSVLAAALISGYSAGFYELEGKRYCTIWTRYRE